MAITLKITNNNTLLKHTHTYTKLIHKRKYYHTIYLQIFRELIDGQEWT